MIMSSCNEKIIDLKLKLQSANRQKLRNSKMENSLRNLERTLTEQITISKSECELLAQQIEDIKKQISETKCQMILIDVCKVSQKTKIENHIANINAHKKGFDDMFAREQMLSELHKEELKEKVAQEEDMERQNLANAIELNELKGKEAAAIEEECVALERECIILMKRNKAKMLKLRRELVDSEDTRLELMRKIRLAPPSFEISGQK